MNELKRYSLIKDKMPRELVLLKGRGCKWKKCVFCDYYMDTDRDPFRTNQEVLKKVTGELGVLDVINSGSMTELDDKTVQMIQDVVEKCGIHTIWFEAHWMYRNKLREFSGKFPGVCVKYRVGVETFDSGLRASMNKGIPGSVRPSEISRYFEGVCLLVGIEGQTKEMVLRDMEIAKEHFEYFSVNIFNENTTGMIPNYEIISWFREGVYPKLSNEAKAEVLLNNTDLGVG